MPWGKDEGIPLVSFSLLRCTNCSWLADPDMLYARPGQSGEANMKRAAVLGMLLSAGCSTAPVADFLDFCKPGRLGPEQVAPYGGVCQPRPGGLPVAGS